ncbi:MAG: response regulator transcription factor [Chloroflexia bacterium]|nr:response regulator transcription factor [Chloroflexia bacterium]
MSIRPQMRIVTADPQPIYRAGIRHLLSALPNLTVVGETGCSVDALLLCERLRPTLLLLDLTMPGALDLLHDLHEQQHPVRVVALTQCVEEQLLHAAMQYGLTAYLLKHIDAFELAQALRNAANGVVTFAPEVAALLADQARPHVADPDRLSQREHAVFALLLHGLSNDAIAERLHISRTTVKFHLRNIYGKLGVRTRVEAISKSYLQSHDAETLLRDRLPPLSRQSLKLFMKGI